MFNFLATHVFKAYNVLNMYGWLDLTMGLIYNKKLFCINQNCVGDFGDLLKNPWLKHKLTSGF